MQVRVRLPRRPITGPGPTHGDLLQVRGTRDPLESRPVEAKLPAPAIHPSWVACLCDRVSSLPTPKPVELCAPGLVVRHASYKYK